MSLKLGIEGSRPPSARSRTSINPITGEEMHSARAVKKHVETIAVLPRPASRPQSRPKDVPSLALGALSHENDPDKMIELDPYRYKTDTPKSANTSVSWGTPSSVASQLRQKELQLQLILDEQKRKVVSPTNSVSRPASGRHVGGAAGDGRLYKGSARKRHEQHRDQKTVSKQQSAWDNKHPCPENIPPPSAKHKQLFSEYQKEMQDSFRQNNIHHLDEHAVEEKIEQLKLEIPRCDLVDELDEEGDQTQKQWTQQPYSKKTIVKRQDIEDLEAENRKKKLVETVMIDQLSRFVVCDPEQNELVSKKPPSYSLPMKKGSYRKLHDSKLQTSGSSTENLLSKKVQFGARMLSRNGRDALRDLTGFFFSLDNSITIYEFRQFGKGTKGAKALPFIKRGIYTIPFGRRKGEMFSIADVMQGMTLSFKTENQPVPDHLLEEDLVHFRVTDVDDDAKAHIILGQIEPADREEVWKRAHLPLTHEEMNDQLLMKHIQEIVHKQIRNRGVKIFRNMSKLFRKYDENKDGKLNKYELEKALYDFRIEIPDDKFDDLWEVTDYNGSSFLDYEEFMRVFIGEMSEKRKTLIRKAFLKMDPTKQGVIPLDAIGKFYNAHKHPKVIAGACRDDEIREQFMASFQDTEVTGNVTYSEFMNYYEGISIGVDSDEDFENIVKNAWSV